MYRKALTSDSLSTTTFFLDKDFPSPPLAASPCRALSLLAWRDPHDLHLLTCAGMALNNHEVHPERAELLLGAAGAAAAGSPAACAARRRVGGWCSRAGGPRATSTSPQSMILGIFSIYIRRTIS